jgi:NAD(P)-dependent dehydrogenase (short-subunit alcohol dehydrogenase family)
VGSLDGRVALVSGASRGIGAAIAKRFAEAGADVAVMARTLEPSPQYEGSLAETVEAINATGRKALAIQSDLSLSADRQRAVSETVAALGPIDILVNNAAVTYIERVESFSEKRFRLMLEVQVRAPFELTQLVLPSMYERGAGWVLNISSRAAIHPDGPPYDKLFERGFSVYGMCKAALERFTTGLASEGHLRGVRSNALAPLDNVATPGAGAHDLVADYRLEDDTVMAEAALALVEGDITGRIALSQDLLVELGRTAPKVTS